VNARRHILITNDDGIDSDALPPLSEALSTLGDVDVVVPERNWSGASHSITLFRPLRVRATKLRNGHAAFMTDGSPTDSVRLAVLGTDSAVGKRTTAVTLVGGLEAGGARAVMIGTGQTAWMQGVRYGLILDSLINDFVSGEIEHQVLRAFREERPDVIVVEGQGCLTNPGYPGGFEILAAARPDGVVLQHAPARTHYDGFPGFPLAGIDREKAIIDLVCGAPVVAITLSHEGLTPGEVRRHAESYRATYRVACCDPLLDGVDPVLRELRHRFPRIPG